MQPSGKETSTGGNRHFAPKYPQCLSDRMTRQGRGEYLKGMRQLGPENVLDLEGSGYGKGHQTMLASFTYTSNVMGKALARASHIWGFILMQVRGVPASQGKQGTLVHSSHIAFLV